MRVLTQNVLMGGEERFDALCRVLAATQPDLLILQECLGWEDGVRLRALARGCEIPADDRHLFLSRSNPRGSGRRYHLALLSRLPLASARVRTGGVAHSIVDATLALPPVSPATQSTTLRVLGAHLVSGDEEARLAETEVLLSHASAALAQGEDLLLAGDLNSLSPRDPYPDDLGDRCAQLGITKYGNPARFDVMRRLFSVGFVDALARRQEGAPWASAVRGRRDGGPDSGPDSGKQVLTRTDYVLLSPGLARRQVGCGLVDVGAASDHHGVYVDLD